MIANCFISPPSDPGSARFAGFTLTELILALALGMLIVLATTTLVVSASAIEASVADRQELQDNASFAMDNISTAVQQAGYVSIDADNGPWVEEDSLSAPITGLDASTLKANSEDISAPTASRNFSSDVLAIRYSGAGQPADGTIVNCAGIGIAAARPRAAGADRGWSIYYVANDASGEPGLYCKYKKDQFTAQAIAQGVESFQVLYGLDNGTATEEHTSRFLTASEISALDAGLAPSELNRKTHWKKVTAVKIALLLRGKSNKISDDRSAVFELFGPQYDAAGTDPGTRITAAEIAPALRSRLRLVCSRTMMLKNPLR